MKRPQLNEEMRVKYSTRLNNQIINQVQTGPVEQRMCTDKLCLIFFILFMITFIGFLVYFLISGASAIKQLQDRSEVQFSAKSIGSTFVKAPGAIIGMIAFSCVLAVLFIFLCAKFPKCVVVSGIVFTFLCYLAVIVLAFMAKEWALAIGVIIAALLNACMLYCWRDKITIGIALLKASGTFMLQKPSIACIGLTSLFFNLLFLVGYVLGWLSAYTQTLSQLNSSESSRNRFTGMMIAFIIMGVFVGYFLYYLMVFVLSTSVAYWYYQMERNVLYGYRNASKHVGSLSLASFIITIITILRQLAQSQYNSTDNVCLKIVWCFVSCIIKCIEGFVQVLNHNAVIVMSITGQNFINSAKTTMGLIFSNYPLFYIVDFISNFIQFYSLIICVLAPAIIAGGIIWAREKVEGTAVIGGVIVFLLAWIVTSVILGILYEALSAVFIVFCFDKNLRARGFTNGRVPQEIRHLFSEVGDQQGYSIHHQPKPATETNLAKGPYYNNPNLQSDKNLVNNDPMDSQKRTRKRKLSRKKAEDNDISLEENKGYEMNNYPNQNNQLRNPNDPAPNSANQHPFYSQQAQ